MRASVENLEWFVGSPVGIHTRVCYDTPSGAHPLTSERVGERYAAEIRNSALVVWHLPDSGIGGVRAGIDEVAWRDADIAYFQTSFCRPAKGSGEVLLTGQRHDNETLNILLSDQFDSAILEWHLAVASILERIYPGLQRTRDNGHDA